MKISVIGAGLGGLTAATSLASKGHDITVFEKNSTFGGKAGEFYSDSFRFDTGPSIVTMPFVIEHFFSEIGEKIDEYLSIKRLDVICKYFFADGTIINAFSDRNSFYDEIERNTKDTRKSLEQYFKYCRRIYDLSAPLFLYSSFDIVSVLNLSGLKTLISLPSLDPFRSVDSANRSFFRDEKTIQLFNRYATYNGSDPYRAPATLNIIPYVEYELGGYIVEGGMYRLPEALYKAALKKGVRFHFNSEVRQISLQRNHSALVSINDNTEEYDAIISNADTRYTYSKLLGQKTRDGESSLSGVIFYWNMKSTFDDLQIHNIFFSANYHEEFRQIFSEYRIPDDPTIYVYISSKFSKADAPERSENWFVMVNAPAVNGQDWDTEILKVRNIIIQKLNKFLHKDLEKLIIREKVCSPKDMEERTNSYKGSIYGYSSNSAISAFLRERNHSRRVSRLYFTGGTAHPGGGIPLVMLSGMITSKLIDKK